MNFRIFEKYDCDRDGALNPQELINLFSTCPLMPWGQDIYNTVTTQPNTGWLGLPGFLGEKKNCGLNYNVQQKPRRATKIGGRPSDTIGTTMLVL